MPYCGIKGSRNWKGQSCLASPSARARSRRGPRALTCTERSRFHFGREDADKRLIDGGVGDLDGESAVDRVRAIAGGHAIDARAGDDDVVAVVTADAVDAGTADEFVV